MRQLICSRSFNTKNYLEATKYLGTKPTDMIAQGYKPNQGGDGVLYHWDNVPLGYYEVPTLNRMIYSKKLWENIINNDLIKSAMEGKCFWGEADHPDRDEVSLKEVACRVNSMEIGNNNIVLGSLDLMDTPNGLICYSLAKTGRIGNSTRGYGELLPSPDYKDLQIVNDADGIYTHVCSDMVALPAVPIAQSSVVEAAGLAVDEIGNLDGYLRGLVKQALDRDPQNKKMVLFDSLLSGNYDKASREIRLAASVEKVNKVRSMLHPLTK